MRIGVLQSAFDRIQSDDMKIYEQALADLNSAGVTMNPLSFRRTLTSIRFLLEAEAAAAFDDITRDGKVRTLKDRTPATGRTVSAPLA